MKKDFLLTLVLSSLLVLFLNQYMQSGSTVQSEKAVLKEKVEREKEETKKINKEFGIAVDSFYRESKTVRRNEFLASIYEKIGISRTRVLQTMEAAEGVFDIRNIKAGRPYTLFYPADTSKTPDYLVYKHSKSEYLKVDLTHPDTVLVQKGEKDIVTRRKAAIGIIESSLWETIQANELSPMLAIRLSEVYAWTIDFFGLKEGDYFKVYYEKEYVDSTAIGVGNILASYFEHRDTSFYAFAYEQDSALGYFDQSGTSLEKEFLKAPLNYSRISSGFSRSRLHPILRKRRPHLGIDYAAPRGTPIHAIGDGVVIKKSYDRLNGRMIQIRHNSVYRSGYIHLYRFAKGISRGEHVEQGETIGYVGSTGRSTGPHLDFRVWKNGDNVNPLQIDAPPVDPIAEDEMKAYKESIKPLKQTLDSLALPVI